MAFKPLIPSHEARSSAEDKSKTSQVTHIHRSLYVIWLVLFYAAPVLSSWIVTCTLTYCPITANHYGAWIWKHQNNGWRIAHTEVIHDLYRRNERWYRAARVIQSIASVLTIPLTSAVCSNAVVVYLQHCNGERTPNFTLCQMIVLADKGWTNVWTYFRLATA